MAATPMEPSSTSSSAGVSTDEGSRRGAEQPAADARRDDHPEVPGGGPPGRNTSLGGSASCRAVRPMILPMPSPVHLGVVAPQGEGQKERHEPDDRPQAPHRRGRRQHAGGAELRPLLLVGRLTWRRWSPGPATTPRSAPRTRPGQEHRRTRTDQQQQPSRDAAAKPAKPDNSWSFELASTRPASLVTTVGTIAAFATWYDLDNTSIRNASGNNQRLLAADAAHHDERHHGPPDGRTDQDHRGGHPSHGPWPARSADPPRRTAPS